MDPDNWTGDLFGSSVAVSGNAIVVGATFGDFGEGRAYVFTQTATGWHQTAALAGPESVTGDDFGSSVAISGSTIVVGATDPITGNSRVFLFTHAAMGWDETELRGSGTARNDWFGTSLAISGSTIVVGAYGHDSNAGRVHVFEG